MNTNMIESVPYRISIPDHGTVMTLNTRTSTFLRFSAQYKWKCISQTTARYLAFSISLPIRTYSYVSIRVPTKEGRILPPGLRCFSGDSGAICKFNKIKSARNEPLLHFSPSKMTTVDPQRTAQIREVLAQTLSPDAATRRTVSFVVRSISIDSISSSH